MRARRREINIFNMSLLDILCGALGAFCFMMLVALPYYKPPGKAPDLKKAQEETDRLMRDLDNMKTKMRDQKSVEEMEELLRRLEAQVKALQGQVNILSAEKEELQRRVTQLSDENENLKRQIAPLLAERDRLNAQVAQLTAEKQKLVAVNQQLTTANKRLSVLLARRKTFVVSAHCTTFIDLLLTDERAGGKTREASNEEVKAFLDDDQSVSASHLYLTKSGSATEIRDEANPEISHKIYVKLLHPSRAGETFPIDGGLITVGREQRMTRWPPFQLSGGRPWILVGTVTIDQNYEPVFKAATESERDAEWEAVTKSAPPASPTATVATRDNSPDTAEKLRRLMRMPPDESGVHDAEVLQLTDDLLKELPPGDLLRRDVELHRQVVLENRARRAGASRSPTP